MYKRYLLKCYRLLVNVGVLFFITLLGACAENHEHVKSMSQQELLGQLDAHEIVLIDVRSQGEYAKGRIPGAINIPHDLILQDTSILASYKNKSMVFYCHSGVRVGKVVDAIRDDSFSSVHHLQGDFRAWQGNSHPLER